MIISLNKKPQLRSQNIIILIIRTSKKVPLVSGTPDIGRPNCSLCPYLDFVS